VIPFASVSAASAGLDKFATFAVEEATWVRKPTCTVTSPKQNFIHNGTILFSDCR